MKETTLEATPLRRRLVVAFLGIVVAGPWTAQAVDLNGTDMTVTSLVGDEVFENSSATAATLTFDLADDVTWTGSVSGPVLLVKTGVGTLTVDGDGYQGTGGVSITGGILKLGDTARRTRSLPSTAVRSTSTIRARSSRTPPAFRATRSRTT